MRPEVTGKKILALEERFGVTTAYSGISRSRIYELLADGTLEGKILHGRRIVVVQSLIRMCGDAPSAKHST
jgi:predicted DNA-binding transcriptional regulator AlpA